MTWCMTVVLCVQQTQNLKQVRTQLAAQQAISHKSQQSLDALGEEAMRLTDSLQAVEAKAQQLEQTITTSQANAMQLESNLSATQADVSNTKAELAMRREQQIATQQQLAEIQQQKSQLQVKLNTTDFEYVEAQKQLKQARTGITNLRNRLDDSETELRTNRVQTSLQVSCQAVLLTCAAQPNRMWSIFKKQHAWWSISKHWSQQPLPWLVTVALCSTPQYTAFGVCRVHCVIEYMMASRQLVDLCSPMMQMTSLSIDLRSRQQQIDSMRAELQKSGHRAAAQRQQNEEATANLMEQLAIAQSVSADTQVSLAACAELTPTLSVSFTGRAGVQLKMGRQTQLNYVLSYSTHLSLQKRLLPTARQKVMVSLCPLALAKTTASSTTILIHPC